MKTVFRDVKSRYLFTAWLLIITFGVCAALFGIQKNSNDDYQDSKNALESQAIAVCHTLADSNQAVLDLLHILALPTPITPDMTPSQTQTLVIANQRKEAYKEIADTLFKAPTCPDGYTAISHLEELVPLATAGPTTSTTIPQEDK